MIITIMPGVPWWGQFHIIVSPNVGSLPVKRVSIQKKERKKGMMVMIMPGIPLWGRFHIIMSLNVGSFPVNKQ